MGDPRWCHVCSGTGIGFDGDECLCMIGNFERQKTVIVPEPARIAGKEDVKRLLGIYERTPTADSEPPIRYVAVAPNDLDELQRKATAYNELKAVIDRLDCEIQDIKRLLK